MMMADTLHQWPAYNVKYMCLWFLLIKLASSSLLRLGQESEKEAIKNRESVYLLLDEVRIITIELLSRIVDLFTCLLTRFRLSPQNCFQYKWLLLVNCEVRSQVVNHQVKAIILNNCAILLFLYIFIQPLVMGWSL